MTMSSTQDQGRQYVPAPSRGFDNQSAAGPSGGALGLTVMAAVLMTLSGIWSFFTGLAARPACWSGPIAIAGSRGLG